MKNTYIIYCQSCCENLKIFFCLKPC